MQILSLTIGILALLVSGYAVYMLTKLVQSLDALTSSMSKATDKLDDLGRQVENQKRELAALEQKVSHPPISGIHDLVPLLLQKSGNTAWGPIAVMGLKACTAYWKKRQGNRKALVAANPPQIERNALAKSGVKKADRSSAK